MSASAERTSLSSFFPRRARAPPSPLHCYDFPFLARPARGLTRWVRCFPRKEVVPFSFKGFLMPSFLFPIVPLPRRPPFYEPGEIGVSPNCKRRLLMAASSDKTCKPATKRSPPFFFLEAKTVFSGTDDAAFPSLVPTWRDDDGPRLPIPTRKNCFPEGEEACGLPLRRK